MEFHEAINTLDDLSLKHPEIYEDLQRVHLAIMKNIFEDSEAYKRIYQLIGEFPPDATVRDINAIVKKRVMHLCFSSDFISKRLPEIKKEPSQEKGKVHTLKFGG